MISIAKTIKALRARKGITQEELASHLGVTYQAISKWERGEGYPDITILPALANFFEVSTDKLLGVDVTKKQEMIDDIVAEAHTFYHRGELDNARSVLECGLVKYPNAHRLLLELIQLKYEYPYGSRTEKEPILLSSIVTLERIMDESVDADIRRFATSLLVRHYICIGENQKAIDIAKTQADINHSSTILLCDLTQGEDRLRHIRHAIRFTLEELNGLFSRLGDYNEDNGYTLDEKLAIRELSLHINEEILGDEAYVGFGWNYWKRCEAIATGYAIKEDMEKALCWLKRAAAIARQHDALPEQYAYSVLPLKGYKFEHCKTTKNYTTTELEQFQRLLQNKVYDNLRSDQRFNYLCEL